VAVVPLTFTGFPHADGHVMGFAIIPPRDSAILDDDAFRRAWRAVAPMNEQRGRRILVLKPKGGPASGPAFSIDLSPTLEADRRSLDPALYSRPARTFASVTPIVLDRHLKETAAARDEEAKAQVATACDHIGLPTPEAIAVSKHSAVEGAASAYPSGRSPAWTGWRLPRSLASRHLIHAVIRFGSAVEGPVLLGAGRYMGLGLCRPVDSTE
jgi:CRISPR-associated protein Csb2